MTVPRLLPGSHRGSARRGHRRRAAADLRCVMIQFGTGKVDFAGVFTKLKSLGFSGPIMIEGTAVGATVQETIANARANREFLEKMI